MSAETFLKTVSILKEQKVDYKTFCEFLETSPEFMSIRSSVSHVTTMWASSNGFITNADEIPDERLSDLEIKIRDYFRNHKFSNMEQTRNIADLCEVLTGVDSSRFIVPPKPATVTFNRNVVVIPRGNNNGHSYKLGDPVIMVETPDIFCDRFGSTGNHMSQVRTDLEVPTDEQISSLLMGIMYNSRTYMLRLVTHYL